MPLVTGVLVQLIALCAFSAVCEQLLAGGRLLASVRFIAGILCAGVMVELMFAVIGLVSG